MNNLQQPNPAGGEWNPWRRINELRSVALSGNWARAHEILLTFPAADHPQIGWRVRKVHYDILVFSIGAGSRAEDLAEALIEFLPEESLTNTNQHGTTALHAAAAVGNTRVATLLAERVPNFVHAADNEDNYPIHIATKFGHRDMVQYLRAITVWDGNGNPHGRRRRRLLQFLFHAIDLKFFDIALELVHDYPWLAFPNEEYNGMTALYHLAGMEHVFPVKSCWGRLTAICYRGRRQHQAQALDLIREVCEQMKSIYNNRDPTDAYEIAIVRATARNNREVVELILEAFPEAIHSQVFNGKTILELAIENRSILVMRFLYQSGGYKHINLYSQDNQGNNLLHHAAKLPNAYIMDRISGPAIQMQREVQWYKAVGKLVPPLCKHQENIDGETPVMIFREEHSKLKMKAEKWMKESAKSYLIVSVVIIILMFYAVTIVPTGRDNEVEGGRAFEVFVYAVVTSLLTSIISLMASLYTLTTGFLSHSFAFKHPRALITSMIALFVSLTSMTVAFILTIYLVLPKNKWHILLPMTGIGCMVHGLFLYWQIPIVDEWIWITWEGILGSEIKNPLFG